MTNAHCIPGWMPTRAANRTYKSQDTDAHLTPCYMVKASQKPACIVLAVAKARTRNLLALRLRRSVTATIARQALEDVLQARLALHRPSALHSPCAAAC
eukprot:4000747-Amphidinium_carterae.1